MQALQHIGHTCPQTVETENLASFAIAAGPLPGHGCKRGAAVTTEIGRIRCS